MSLPLGDEELVPYELVVAIAERELELAASGSLDDLVALQRQRGELIARMPQQAPARARPHLERAAELQRHASELLAQRLQTVRDEFGRVEHGRGALRGYAPPQPRAPRYDCAG